MIAHTGLAVRDFKAAKSFYERTLAPLGYTAKMEHADSTGFNDGKNTDFWIGQSKTVEPTHVAFEAKSKNEVEAFYREALAAGGRDNGSPGYRRDYWPGYYAAFVYDLDGHNIEAVWYDYGAEGATRVTENESWKTRRTSTIC